MKHIMMLLLTFVSFSLNAADVPIIFVDGQKNIAKPFPTDSLDPPYEDADYGIETWYPMKNDSTFKFPTAMTKIVGYNGYQYGLKLDGSLAITCDETTQLQNMPNARRIYNFSYYRPDGSPGAIGNNENLVPVDENTISDTLKQEKGKIPFWRKLSYGIGYSSGIGRVVEIQLEPLSPNLWGIFLWNNTLNMNLDYHFNTNWEVKLGIGYLWTKAWIRMLESFNFVSLGKRVSAVLISSSILYSNSNRTKIGPDCRFTSRWGEYGKENGKEIGILFSFIPIKREFNPKFKYNISLSVRYSLGKTSYMFATERKELFDYDILELSLKVNLYHAFNNTKKERRSK